MRKVVLRLLVKENLMTDVEKLGLDDIHRQFFMNAISRPFGLERIGEGAATLEEGLRTAVLDLDARGRIQAVFLSYIVFPAILTTPYLPASTSRIPLKGF
ncbi:MAG TPA: hypothetical protein EYQ20_18320 [candidate division Zixibacteria bacterium]|nr:hypothetical protein [Candidatus Latescibacterota bacterium]HIG48283.1 hypothetical protein [candidate division Zixibacteria bacterium]